MVQHLSTRLPQSSTPLADTPEPARTRQDRARRNYSPATLRGTPAPQTRAYPMKGAHRDNGDLTTQPSAATDYIPATVQALFWQEGLEDAPRHKQANAIRHWLTTHHMTPIMEYSIRMHGFSEILDPQRQRSTET